MLDTGGRAGALGFLSSRGHLIALALLVGLALFLRLYGINWDQGGLYHPDERAIVMKVSQITFPTGDLGSLFTDESALNPAWFPYGSLPLYLLKLTGFLAPPFFDDPSLEKLAIMGRAISALADVATIVLIYVVGSRLFGRWAGLLGASVITLSALHIQQSHFFVTDIMLAAMLMASFLFLSRAMEDGRLKTFALAALFFGLALSTKFSASPFALAFIAAGALWAFREGRGHPELRGRLIHGTKALFMSGGITILVFAIAQPYAIIDIDTYASYIARESDMVRRISDLPFTRQYVDTTPYWYQVQQLATWGVGLPFGLLLWGGFAFSLVMGLWRRDGRHLLMLSWVVPYFAVVGSFDVKFMRYMLPITPFLAIMGGSLVTWTVGWLREHQRFFLRPQLIYGLVAVAMVATLLYAVSYSRIYSQPHTATSAAAWINANVPTGSTLVKEHWEEGIRDLYNYQHKDLDLYNDENPTKRLHMIQRLVEADYLLFYSNRLYSTIPRLEERYPMTGAYYASLFGGELGFELVHWESSYPNLFGLSLAHDTFSRVNLAVPISLQGYKQTPAQWTVGFADESFTVYDHPLVLIFRKAISGPTQQQAEFFDSVLPQPGTVSNDTLGAELLLSPDDLRAQQEGGTRSRIFNRDSFVNSVPAVVWFLVVQLAFLLALPITLLIFRWLPDRGYLLGKMLGLLLISYVPWLLASLQWLSFSRFSVFLGMVLVGLASAVILKFKWRDMLTFLREHRRMILVGEGLFAVAFAGLFAVRLWNPDLWHPFFGGGEAHGLRLLQRRGPFHLHAALRPLVFGRATQLLLLRVLHERRVHEAHRHSAVHRHQPRGTAILRADGGGGFLYRIQPRELGQGADVSRGPGAAADAIAYLGRTDGGGLCGGHRQPGRHRAGRAGQVVRLVQLLAVEPDAGVGPGRDHRVSFLHVPVRRPARALVRDSADAAGAGAGAGLRRRGAKTTAGGPHGVGAVRRAGDDAGGYSGDE